MTDIIDVQQTFSIALSAPPIPEGIASIVGVDAPTEAAVGETVNITTTIRNDGDNDSIFVTLTDVDTGTIVGARQEAVLSAGQEIPFSWGLTMLDRTYNLRLDAGHTE